ncbi:MAG: hypothetical protein LBU27_09630 [Candidatus Peribacteria bacterium]|jgi:hypothetical protein|nr:hypothetical protein [Candidatus Peribacteria bacterium]
MNTLNNKIKDILQKHQGGGKFFDALDMMIRSDFDILESFLDFVSRDLFVTLEYS